jgi:di/tripeptidase
MLLVLQTLPLNVSHGLHGITTSCQVRLDGLMGGHSGLNIHEDRGNAVQLMARSLTALLGSVPGCRLAEVRGGDKRNAIAREALATILVSTGSAARFMGGDACTSGIGVQE